MFAVGWGVAIVPFVASLLHTVIYPLGFDYLNTKTEMARNYENRIVRNGKLIDILAVPIVVLILASRVLGDFRVINPDFGLVNGILNP